MLALVDRKCLVCSSPVEKMREYCSDDCYYERRMFLRRVKIIPTCLLCSREYERTGNRQKVCSDCRPNKTRVYTAQYNSVNEEQVKKSGRESMRKQRLNDPQKYRDRDKKWRMRHCETIAERRKTPEARAKANEYTKERYRTDLSRNVTVRMRSAIHQALKGRKNGRKWEDLVGYTCADLVRHLERQFIKGMSWSNMGEWHIDHIVPKSSFNYTDETCSEFKACWALTNLRPLWRDDNQSKHASREFLL